MKDFMANFKNCDAKDLISYGCPAVIHIPGHREIGFEENNKHRDMR